MTASAHIANSAAFFKNVATPAMALGIADHVWSIGELLQAALGQIDRPELGARYGRFTVIDGGQG